MKLCIFRWAISSNSRARLGANDFARDTQISIRSSLVVILRLAVFSNYVAVLALRKHGEFLNFEKKMKITNE